MQEEYEEALQDEVNRTLNSTEVSQENQGTTSITALPSTIRKSASKLGNVSTKQLPRITTQNLSDEASSCFSSDSSCGMIDGEITRKILNDLDLSSPGSITKETNIMKSIENIEKIVNSNETVDTSNNNSGDTSNGSASLLDLKKLHSTIEKSKKCKENGSVNMELTGVVGNLLKVTTANKLLPEKDTKRPKRSFKQRLFPYSSCISNNSDITELSHTASGQSTVASKSSDEMSSLKLSVSADKCGNSKGSVESSDLMPSLKLSASIDKPENKKGVPAKRISTRKSWAPERYSPSTASKETSSTMSPEADRDNANIINNGFVTIRKGKYKIRCTSPVVTSPKLQEKDHIANKKIRKRKLYNPDEELNYSKENDESLIQKKLKSNSTIKTATLTPLLLTKKAKLFLENKQSKKAEEEDLKTKTQTTPQRKVKITKTAKKATANKISTEQEEKLIKRSSSFYFDKSPIKCSQKIVKKKTSIVCTRLHKPDWEIFEQIVKKLGGFFVEDEVSSDTSHLVAGEPKRTINLLRALARGCWILKHEWVSLFEKFLYFFIKLCFLVVEIFRSWKMVT